MNSTVIQSMLVADTISELYVDWHKFKGGNARVKVPHLQELLHYYNLDQLLDFFSK